MNTEPKEPDMNDENLPQENPYPTQPQDTGDLTPDQTRRAQALVAAREVLTSRGLASSQGVSNPTDAVLVANYIITGDHYGLRDTSDDAETAPLPDGGGSTGPHVRFNVKDVFGRVQPLG